jgi:hypothetical protein
MKQQEIERLKKIVEDRFDSRKNWSIMINDKHNDTRNEVMQKVKLEQYKKKFLHDFLRKAREDLLKARHQDSHETDTDEDGLNYMLKLQKSLKS